MSLKTDIKLGQTYRDNQTGYEGVAVCITFWQHSCERIGLESYDADRKDVKIETFDAPRLMNMTTLEVAKATKTGGDQFHDSARTDAKR